MHIKGLKSEWYANLNDFEKAVVWKWISRITVLVVAIVGFALILYSVLTSATEAEGCSSVWQSGSLQNYVLQEFKSSHPCDS